jgi:hypothetical protein
LNFYLDIQNLYNFKSEKPDDLMRTSTYLVRPVESDPYVDEKGVERCRLICIQSSGQGTILLTVGIIIEF